MSNFNVHNAFFSKGRPRPLGIIYIFAFCSICIEAIVLLRRLESDIFFLRQLENNVFIYYFLALSVISMCVFLILSAGKIIRSISSLTILQFALGVIVILLIGSASTALYFKNQTKLLNQKIQIEKTAREINIDVKGIGTKEILTADSPTPSPTEIPKKAYITTLKNSDAPIHCQTCPKCGGGATPLKQSECDTSTCCGFNN